MEEGHLHWALKIEQESNSGGDRETCQVERVNMFRLREPEQKRPKCGPVAWKKWVLIQ